MSEKILTKSGLNELVLNHLKPENEADRNSQHPVTNQLFTQTILDTLSTVNNLKAIDYVHFSDVASLPSTNSSVLNEIFVVGQRAILDNNEIYEVTAIDSETGEITWTKTDLMLGGGKINAVAVENLSEVASLADGVYYNIDDGKTYEIESGVATESSKEINICEIDYSLYNANEGALSDTDMLFIITNAPGGPGGPGGAIDVADVVEAGNDNPVTSDAVNTALEDVYDAIDAVPKGTVTQVSAGTGLTGGPITTSGSLSLATSGVSAGTYGPSGNVTGNNGTTIAVPQISVDAYGRVTGVINRTYTSVNTDTNTHYTTTAKISGASQKASISIYDDNTLRSTLEIEADAGISFNSDSSGKKLYFGLNKIVDSCHELATSAGAIPQSGREYRSVSQGNVIAHVFVSANNTGGTVSLYCDENLCDTYTISHTGNYVVTLFGEVDGTSLGIRVECDGYGVGKFFLDKLVQTQYYK